MATYAKGGARANVATGFMADQGFFVRYAIFLGLFIMFGFIQFALRGFSNFREAPAIVHLHGGLMVSWLGIFIAQNLLIHKGELGVHRKLGWASAVLVVVLTVTMVMTGYKAIEAGRQPPFFSAAVRVFAAGSAARATPVEANINMPSASSKAPDD